MSLGLCPHCHEFQQDDYCANCGHIPATPDEERRIPCLSDIDRRHCRATITQRRTPRGWSPWFCPECDAAWAARRASREAA